MIVLASNLITNTHIPNAAIALQMAAQVTTLFGRIVDK